ncbi:MAG: hypothetical protein WBF90_33630 [Rivularia sp. (in: cyanobacteria)]
MTIYLPSKSKNTSNWIEITNFEPGHFSATSTTKNIGTVAYKKIGDLVFFRGVIRKTSNAFGEAFTIPSVIAPNREINFILNYASSSSNDYTFDSTSDLDAWITTGNKLRINLSSSSNLYVPLSNVCYAL